MILSTVLALFVMTSSPAHAIVPLGIDYNITLNDYSPARTCVSTICKIAKTHGGGYCKYLSAIRVLSVNLTTEGVNKVRATQCAAAMEVELEMNASPRVGRGNN